MKLYRIWGLTLRYLYTFAHSYDRLSDAFFWPLVDLVLWGLTSRFFISYESNGQLLILMLLGGIILWIFPWRAQYELAVNLLEDLWNRNLINIFATPVLFQEWVITLMFIGVFKAIVSFGFAGLLAYLLYATNVFTLGWLIFPWAVILVMFGWVFGLLVTSLVMRFGTKIQTLAWTSIYLVAPFAAVYYPVSVLPSWAQIVAKYVPASYIFEAMRAAVSGHPQPLSTLVFPAFLCVVYLSLALTLLLASFRAILKRGLISVE